MLFHPGRKAYPAGCESFSGLVKKLVQPGEEEKKRQAAT